MSKATAASWAEDEETTIRTLTAYREVMTTLIQQHRGRVVDSPGDNLLAEFASAVDAVQCAVEIQRELKVRNTELSDQRQSFCHYRSLSAAREKSGVTSVSLAASLAAQ